MDAYVGVWKQTLSSEEEKEEHKTFMMAECKGGKRGIYMYIEKKKKLGMFKVSTYFFFSEMSS